MHVLVIVLLLAACAARPAAAGSPPTGPGDLTVTLAWEAPVDLDLYLTEPGWETLYFANNPTRAGARLEEDVRCDTLAAAPPRERARIAAPAPGRYRVGIDFIDACGSKAASAPFRIAVELGGQRLETTGKALLEQFQVIVVEFDLVRAADGSLALQRVTTATTERP